MQKQNDPSETTQHICDLSFMTSQNMNYQTETYEPNKKPKKRFFEVFHKKETIYSNQETISNSEESKFPSVQYKCIYCGNKYNNMNRFEAHMRMHTGEKPFKCPFCCKIFTEKGNLKVHIRVHTNDRPYHCPFKDICKQSFKTKSQLSDHILKHTRVKNYCCPECKSSFSRKSRLKIHLMIHKGEKPFQCEICSKRFREKSNYNFHMKKHMAKLNKNKENKHNFEQKDLVMDPNINNFCIYEKNKHKLSDLSNSTNSNISFEIINKSSEDEKNDNIINQKTKAIFQIINQKDKNSNDDKMNCPYLDDCSNEYIINCDDDLKSLDEQSLKYGLNIDNNGKNTLLNSDYMPFFKKEEELNEESEISSSIVKEENEEEKNEQNLDEISIVNGICDNIVINNAINKKINLTVFNNNFCQSYFPLNFESMFSKNNFN